MAEHVDIDLPLSPRHASTVRAVAASVGADVGLSVDQIDDLRLGVNEAIAILTDVDVPEGVDALATSGPALGVADGFDYVAPEPRRLETGERRRRLLGPQAAAAAAPGAGEF